MHSAKLAGNQLAINRAPLYSVSMKKSRSGFTIVELLIVIVVIAILASISVVAYAGIQTRAQASAIAADLKAAEKALNAYRISSGADGWWIDNDALLTGTGNPSIQSIMNARAEFRNYLDKVPTKDGLGTSSNWFYDNDNDSFAGCGDTVTKGANIMIGGATLNTSLMEAIDTVIDDGDLSCGKVRNGINYFVYGLN